MRSTKKLATATPDTIRSELIDTVEHLLTSIRRDSEVLEELQEVCDLLDSLLLATGEHCTATNRLRNAHRYLVSKERGAARYELQLLAGSLRSEAATEVRRHLRKRVNA